MIGADNFVNDLEPHRQSLHATQRYQQGFSDIDMWNFDYFLADVIVAGCNWMIAEGKGTPVVLDSGEDWNAILKEIRDGFSHRDDTSELNPPKRAWKLLRKYFKYMWD